MKHSLKVVATAVVGSLAINGLVQAAGHQEGDFILRVGAAYVSPNDDSSNVLSDNDGVEVDGALGLGFSGTWMFADQWGFEILAALPFEHDIDGTGDLSGVSIGSVKHLPPTFSVQFYPDVQSDYFIPYFGLGLNYTTFTDEDTDSELEAALGSNDVDLDLDDSFGIAAQIGADWKISDDLYFNTSLWYMQIDTDADVKVDGVVATTVDVDIDPWVAMIGLSWKF
ncbi:OmpW family protein [Kangiella sp. TOML190]|uniref:OmpW/AlkL family protein n=1 Tax=Kangiella sp. TOML190 TaxID=2931351 RepID=UPI00203AB61E|nr:OmpW family outer membrane protein [Kangiella sp. TOML190]